MAAVRFTDPIEPPTCGRTACGRSQSPCPIKGSGSMPRDVYQTILGVAIGRVERGAPTAPPAGRAVVRPLAFRLAKRGLCACPDRDDFASAHGPPRSDFSADIYGRDQSKYLILLARQKRFEPLIPDSRLVSVTGRSSVYRPQGKTSLAAQPAGALAAQQLATEPAQRVLAVTPPVTPRACARLSLVDFTVKRLILLVGAPGLEPGTR
jgi:hypothetical protein